MHGGLEADTRRGAGPRRLTILLPGAAIIFVALRIAAGADAVPYNVRELFRLGPTLSSLVLTAALYGLFAPLGWLTGWLARPGRRAAGLLVLTLAHAFAAYAVLRAAVPLESLHDIVGYPVWGTFPEAERLLRFVALFGAVVLLLLLGGLLARRAAGSGPGSGRALRNWLPAALVVLPAGYLLTIPFAATDNLVELVEQASLAGGSGLIALAVVVLGCAAGLLAALLAGSAERPATALVLVFLSLPATYGLLWAGTEDAVSKYGETFPALAFLLSPGRDALAGGWDLVFRYGAAHVALAGLIALVQAPLWPPGAERPHREQP